MNTSLAYKEPPRFEKFNGTIIMMSPARMEHVVVTGNIYAEFHRYLKGKKCIAFPDGLVYVLEKGKNEFVPDVSILCDRSKLSDNGKVNGAPDLVVEVYSRSTAKFDRYDKMIVYEKAGVREYWIANPYIKSVEVFLLVDGKFQLDDIYHYYTDEELQEKQNLPNTSMENVRQEIRVSLYDDLIVSLKDIFEY